MCRCGAFSGQICFCSDRERALAAAVATALDGCDGDIEHTPRDGCGCDLCAAYYDEQCAVAEEHRDAWITALENEPWPAGSALPWELASTPANDTYDVGEAA